MELMSWSLMVFVVMLAVFVWLLVDGIDRWHARPKDREEWWQG